MGASHCCAQKRSDFSIDWINDHLVLPAAGGAGQRYGYGAGGSASSSDPAKPGFVFGGPLDEDVAAVEVAWQIAADRHEQLFEAASLMPVLYEIIPASPEEPPHTASATHRKTGVTRRVARFQKPRGPASQERLRVYLASLQRFSQASDSIARVFEVFEDYMDVHLLHETCNGGTIYERILDSQYFTEQEAAMLVRHILKALIPFHDGRVYHGSLTPDSFRFQSDAPHAPLKLVDYGIDLKVHRWDAMEHMSGVNNTKLQNPRCPEFYETCKLVFYAPEILPPARRRPRDARRALMCDLRDWQASTPVAPTTPDESLGVELLDGELLADVLDKHPDWFEEQIQQDNSTKQRDYSRKFETADLWSIGVIAFVLLCGYPPFFAPTRNQVLTRIHKGEITFDAPFWSKISEDGKNFVTRCLKSSCWDRMSVEQALAHPWIQSLADSSPSGAMFPSFMLNLRRFYRTSLIETYVANMLAARLSREDLHDFLRRCREIDTTGVGYFTASDLKHIMTALGHRSVAEAVTARFLRAFRHPGESFIDYVTLLDSVLLRQQRLFEEELWRHFQRVSQSTGREVDDDGWLQVNEFDVFFNDAVIMGLLMNQIPQSAGVEESAVRERLRSSIRKTCAEQNSSRLEYRGLALLLLKLVRSFSESEDEALELDIAEAVRNTML